MSGHGGASISGFTAFLWQGVEDAEAEAPAVARETPLGRLWYRPDKAFRTPKAVVYLDIESPAAYSSPESSVLTRIFTKLLNDSLNELVYPADLAGALKEIQPGAPGRCRRQDAGWSVPIYILLWYTITFDLIALGLNVPRCCITQGDSGEVTPE